MGVDSVIRGWADVPASSPASWHVRAFIRGRVDDNAGARWCKGTPVEVKDAMEARIGGEPGLAARGAKEVQRDVSLWHEQIPFGEREFGVAKSETRTEMVLPGLDSTFGRVAAMAVWRNALEVNVVLLEGLLELVRALVVKNVERRGVAVGLKAGVQSCPGGSKLAGLAGFEWFGENRITVIIVEYHNIIVASRGLDGEFSGLVRVRFL